MHLRDNVDLVDFLMAVRACQKEVFFETTEGDCLALRSSLSQYIFCALANEPELLQSGSIRCEDRDDLTALTSYLV